MKTLQDSKSLKVQNSEVPEGREDILERLSAPLFETDADIKIFRTQNEVDTRKEELIKQVKA